MAYWTASEFKPGHWYHFKRVGIANRALTVQCVASTPDPLTFKDAAGQTWTTSSSTLTNGPTDRMLEANLTCVETRKMYGMYWWACRLGDYVFEVHPPAQ